MLFMSICLCKLHKGMGKKPDKKPDVRPDKKHTKTAVGPLLLRTDGMGVRRGFSQV